MMRAGSSAAVSTVTKLSDALASAGASAAARAVPRLVDHQHQLEIRQPVADRPELGVARRVRDHRPGAGIAEAEGERILAEQREQRDGDQAGLVAGDMSEGGLRPLR